MLIWETRWDKWRTHACNYHFYHSYVPWNLHEPERGSFDFSGNLDLE